MTAVQSTPTGLPPERPVSRRSRALWWAIAILALLVMGLGAGLVATRGNDAAGPGTSSPRSTQGTTPSTSSSTTPVVDRATAVWPVEGSGEAFTDPVAAARSFATDFLHFQSPLVGDFQQGDSRSGEVEVRAKASGAVTTVLVRQLSGEDTWSVLGAATELIEITEPDTGAAISSPLGVRGAALAFEGTVQVEVREDGRPDAIGSGYVTGGGDIMRPFEGRITFPTPASERGALVLYTVSMEDGQVWSATVIRVAFQTTGATVACGKFQAVREHPGAGDMEVTLFFHCDAAGEDVLVPVYRHVASSAGVLKASLTALLEGPNAAERTAKIGSWFSADTAGMLTSVKIAAGHAVVDFKDLRSVIPNASASLGSARLMAELDATVFQFSTIASVEYRIDGSCEAFTEWLQIGGCEPRTRPSS
jgi:hypothetical protein